MLPQAPARHRIIEVELAGLRKSFSQMLSYEAEGGRLVKLRLKANETIEDEIRRLRGQIKRGILRKKSRHRNYVEASILERARARVRRRMRDKLASLERLEPSGLVSSTVEGEIEPVVNRPTLVQIRKKPVSKRRLVPTVLESFVGVVDRIDDGTAFVTLTSNSGEELLGEYSAAELTQRGIQERRRFTCQTVLRNGKVGVRFEPIPELEWTTNDEESLNCELNDLISGGELDAAD